MMAAFAVRSTCLGRPCDFKWTNSGVVCDYWLHEHCHHIRVHRAVTETCEKSPLRYRKASSYLKKVTVHFDAALAILAARNLLSGLGDP